MKYIGWSLVLFFISCYSFRGTSIAPNVSRYYVDEFQNNAGNAPADIAQQFSELLIQKINNSSKLNYSDTEPDIEFSGTVRNFVVRAVAPQAGSRTAFNRLEISVQVEYVNNLDEDENWSQSFSFFQDFASTENLGNIQDQLISDIFEQLAEDIFNRAFTNW